MNQFKIFILFSVMLKIPWCLAGSCGDIEITGHKITVDQEYIVWKTKDEKPKNLLLAGNAPDCESMQLTSFKDAVIVQFWSGDTGTSTVVNTKYWALLDVETGKWLIKPQETENEVTEKNKPQKNKVASIEIVSDKNGYKVVRKDLETGKIKTLLNSKIVN